MGSFKSLEKVALIPPVGLAIIYVLMALLNIGEGKAYPSPDLLFALNTLFLTVSGLVVAALSAWSYHSEGDLSLLFLGMATAIGGVLASVAGFAASISVNYNVALFNLGFFFSGGFQLLSAVLIVAGAVPSSQVRRKHLLLLGYLTVTALVITITALVLGGLAPTFFSASGPTAIRQWLIVGAGTLSAVSSALLGWQYRISKSRVIFWYALALALLALSLIGLATYETPNGPYNWATRVSYWLAGVYFLMAILMARPIAGLDSTSDYSVSSSWAEAFRSDSRQLENLFSRMFDGFSYHKIVVKEGKPVDYVYLAVNDAFEKMTGLQRAKIIGKKVTEVLPGIEKDPADWIGVYGKVAITGKPIIFENYAATLDRWYSVSAYSPRKSYFVVISEDITERKKAEAALADSERLYHSIFDNTEDGFQLVELIYDETGHVNDFKFLRVNAAYERNTGLKSDFVAGKTARQFDPNIERRWLQYYESVDIAGKAIHLQDYNQNTKRWLDVYTYPFGKGKVGSLFRDITDRKKLEKQVQDSERLAAIGATAGMVGHDIRNPLQAISSDVYLLKSELDSMPESKSKENVSESLQGIEQNVDYINKIVQDLQDYARPLNPRIEESDLKTIVDTLISKNQFPENVKVRLKIANEANKIPADSYYLNRILSNLVTNAVQAMPDGGKLTIEAHTENDDVVLTIKDTGVGIPKEIRDKMFNIMFTTKSKGQGFGLPVVKRMTESLGGTVTFESEEGKGTTFTLRFPSQR